MKSPLLTFKYTLLVISSLAIIFACNDNVKNAIEQEKVDIIFPLDTISDTNKIENSDDLSATTEIDNSEPKQEDLAVTKDGKSGKLGNKDVIDKKLEPSDKEEPKTNPMDDFFDNANSFFKKNVRNGKVDYQGITGNTNDLNELVAFLSDASISKSNMNTYKAFWINAYNILTIKGIVDNYPIKQPLDVDGFFDKKKFAVGGEQLTLNDIENKKLRAVLNDARIHFVLVCGAQSCPPIISEAYYPKNVNALMEQQTKKATNADFFVKVNDGAKTATVSMLMKWYKDDFVNGTTTEIDFINKYRTTKIPADYTLKYQDYNWDLNKQ
jgi:hypothetical protein